MGEEHFALFLEDALGLAVFLLEGGKGNVFERKAHKLLRPFFIGLDGGKGGAARINGVPQLLCKAVSVAGGAGGGVAHAAGCHDDFVSADDFAIFGFNAGRGFVFRDDPLYGGVETDGNAQTADFPFKAVCDIACVVAFGEDALAALHFELGAGVFNQIHKTEIVKAGKRRIQETRISHDVFHEFLAFGGICHIAAALAGDVDFFAELFVFFKKRYARACLRGIKACHDAGGAAADNNDFRVHLLFSAFSEIYAVFRPDVLHLLEILADLRSAALGKRDDERVDQRKRRGHGVYKGCHVAFCHQAVIGFGVKRGEGAVGNGDERCASGTGELHGLYGVAGVAREGDAQKHVLIADSGNLLENVRYAAGYGVDVGEDKVEIVAEEFGEGSAGAKTENIDVSGLQHALDNGIKGGEVQLVQRGADILNVGFENLVENLRVTHIARHFKSLCCGQTVTDQLLQSFLQLGVAVIAERGCETHNRGLRYAYIFTESGGGHKRRLVIMGDDAFRDAAVALG